MEKMAELSLARGILDRLIKDYPSMFDKDGELYTPGWAWAKTRPTRVKEELRLVRRLLLEVEKAL